MSDDSEKSATGAGPRELILSAAAKEFAKHGFAGSRMDVIAEKAGVNKATIYYHIGDKESLYKEVILDVLGGISNDLDKKVALGTTIEDKFRAYVLAIATNIGSSRLFSPIIMRELADGATHMPDEIKLKMKSIVQSLMSILKSGMLEGKFRESEPLVIHLMIIGAINFYVCCEPIRKVVATGSDDKPLPEEPLEVIGAKIAEFILNGLTINR